MLDAQTLYPFFAGLIVVSLLMMFPQKGRRRWRGRSARRHSYPNLFKFSDSDFKSSVHGFSQAPDAAEQLRTVTNGVYEQRPILNKSEAKIFHWAEDVVREGKLPWRVMAQVAMGQVLSSPDKDAHAAINAKRADILIVTKSGGYPVFAVEYQGEGHYQGNAPIRDAIKREAFRRAGVGFIEVTSAHSRDDLKREMMRFATGKRTTNEGDAHASSLS